MKGFEIKCLECGEIVRIDNNYKREKEVIEIYDEPFFNYDKSCYTEIEIECFKCGNDVFFDSYGEEY